MTICLSTCQRDPFPVPNVPRGSFPTIRVASVTAVVWVHLSLFPVLRALTGAPGGHSGSAPPAVVPGSVSAEGTGGPTPLVSLGCVPRTSPPASAGLRGPRDNQSSEGVRPLRLWSLVSCATISSRQAREPLVCSVRPRPPRPLR